MTKNSEQTLTHYSYYIIQEQERIANIIRHCFFIEMDELIRKPFNTDI